MFKYGVANSRGIVQKTRNTKPQTTQHANEINENSSTELLWHSAAHNIDLKAKT